MRKLTILFIALCCVAGAARASPELFRPGTGVPNVASGSGDAIWSEPADLNGCLVTSEVISSFGLETEVANDFVAESDVSRVTWWGGFYNVSSPCQPGMRTPGFNIRLYGDGGFQPGAIIEDIPVLQFVETPVGCQSGVMPLFQWDVYGLYLHLTSGEVYWLGIQMMDHPYPPEWGRLASGGVVGHESVFRGDIFSYPQWTPISDVLGFAFDASQELLLPNIGGEVDYGACCFESGYCRLMYPQDCTSQGGHYLGTRTTCLPNNPCGALSDVSEDRPLTKRSATWGEIKGLYR